MIKLFKGRRGASIADRLRNQDYSGKEERDALLTELVATPDLTLDDLIWTIFTRDGMIRRVGAQAIRDRRFPGLVEHFIRNWDDLAPASRKGIGKILPELAPPGWERQAGRFLNHRSGKLRSAAEELVESATLTPKLLDVLVPILSSVGNELRRKLLVRFADSNDARLAPLFEQHLADPDEGVRLAAVRVLAARNDPKFLPALAARLDVETFSVQQQLIKAFIRYAEAGQDVTSQVLPLISSGSVPLRQTAMKILTQMPNQRRVILEFIEYSKTLAGWIRRRALDSMLEFSGLLLDPILSLLQDRDPSVRSSAIRLAASIGADPRVEKALLPLVMDTDWWVRVNAIETLGDLKSQLALPTLLKLLNDDDARWSAIEALVRIGDKRCVPHLLPLLKTDRIEIRLELVKALGKLRASEGLVELKARCETDESAEVRAEAYRALVTIARENHGENESESAELRRKIDSHIGTSIAEQPDIVKLLLHARAKSASDVHISVGAAPLMRCRGELVPVEGRAPLDAIQALELVAPMLTPAQQLALQTNRSVELCYDVPEMGRYRGSIFVDQKGLNAVFRLIPTKVPTISEIGLPPHLSVVTTWHQGLILIVGPAGSGKTTTLTALVDLFNETRQSHIVTIEDPIEFVHTYKNSVVSQRQLGRDTHDYHRAMRAVLREDPDIIVLGEMRDANTLRKSLEAAETGHLVIGTINGTSASRAVDRLINAFPPSEQSQIRTMLADTLKLVVAQALLPRADGRGRVALFEVLMGLSTVGALIRENKTMMIESLMQTGRQLGMRTFDDALYELVVDRNLVSPQVGYLRARKKDRFEPLVSTEFLEGVLA